MSTITSTSALNSFVGNQLHASNNSASSANVAAVAAAATAAAAASAAASSAAVAAAASAAAAAAACHRIASEPMHKPHAHPQHHSAAQHFGHHFNDTNSHSCIAQLPSAKAEILLNTDYGLFAVYRFVKNFIG